MSADISIELFGKKMKNPLIMASGFLGVSKKGLERVAMDGAGGLTTKSISIEPRKGHETPIFIETECGALNAVGYSNPGIDYALEEFSGWDRDESLILSITGRDQSEFARLAKKAEEAKLNIAAIEAVISCPHTPGYGLMAGQGTPEKVAETTSAIKDACKLPLIIKLSPSGPEEVRQAVAAEEAGADAINMGNTLGPGMKIDIERKCPILSFGRGGLSGPAIRPITVRCVYDIYDSVAIPIIGTGGITCGNDAVEMIMAGASVLGIGTAIYYEGPKAFARISEELSAWMDLHGYSRIDELRGVAHGN
jgi:dihydroorotate dehydrogenase (NAD+) catalytic subunit